MKSYTKKMLSLTSSLLIAAQQCFVAMPAGAVDTPSEAENYAQTIGLELNSGAAKDTLSNLIDINDEGLAVAVDDNNNVTQIEYPVFLEEVASSKQDARMTIGLKQDIRCLLTLGGTQHYKGVDILLEALRMVKEPFQLYMTGVIRDYSLESIMEKIAPFSQNVILNMNRLSDSIPAQSLCLNSSFLPNGSTAVNLNERSIESGILKKYDLNESCLQDWLQGRCDYDAVDSGLI